MRRRVAVLLLGLCGCRTAAPAGIHGRVAPGFENVRTEFARNFASRGEKGAALAVMYRGELVVDLWGGERNPQHDAWEEHTLVPVYSTTKGIGALALAVAHARGWFSYDSTVATYWPEFAQNGKARITVRQLLSHEAGLVLLDQPVPLALVRDLDALAVVLARQRPRWEPGVKHGYHLSTLGFYMNELLRRVDPSHRSIGRFVQDEQVGPANASTSAAWPLEFYIGVPDSLTRTRVADVYTVSPLGGMAHFADPPAAVLFRMMWPKSLFARTMSIPKGFDVNDPQWWRMEIVSGLGIGSARSIATLYGLFATGGSAFGLDAATRSAIEAAPHVPRAGPKDAVVGVDMYLGLGFMKPSPSLTWGSSARAYGMPGAGGSFGFADPDAQLGYAYVMNKMGYRLDDDPRELALRRAVYGALKERARQQR